MKDLGSLRFSRDSRLQPFSIVRLFSACTDASVSLKTSLTIGRRSMDSLSRFALGPATRILGFFQRFRFGCS
ncbi:unnamed protein product [Arabis nemorensis]|uniref:Uncharacterized protein n=1 Tax=Arabis nemorensis TaxID=586526 RepID=A0A565BRP2_9BRAS|nr:unnamed protein product [Arabis nemorensis]